MENFIFCAVIMMEWSNFDVEQGNWLIMNLGTTFKITSILYEVTVRRLKHLTIFSSLS